MELKGRKVVVLGLGDTGLSMARWLVRKGAAVKVADSRAVAPHAEALARELPGVPLATGAFTDETVSGAELVAVSPGIDRREPPVATALARGVPVVGDVELFAQALVTGHRSPATPKVLAVTGTNGKSTVTAMAGEMCRAAGYETVVAGNIGLPVLDALAAVEDGAPAPHAYVLELSSFQLESTATLAPDAATLLNLTEDHMDRYDGLSDYAAAKSRVFNGDGVQVLNRDDRWSMGMARAGRTILTFGSGAPRADDEWGIGSGGDPAGSRSAPALMHGARRLLALEELPAKGLHNAGNALAAHALCSSLGLADESTAAALRSYRGLPHRLQKVGEKDGVAWYDDSKGTNVGATVAALTGMDVPVVLIAGGDGKGQDFAPLAAAVAHRAREVVLIGRDAEAIARALDGSGVKVSRASGMNEAVLLARAAARPGDAVLLSPACASLDMFRNYAHRGDVFVAAVRALGGRA